MQIVIHHQERRTDDATNVRDGRTRDGRTEKGSDERTDAEMDGRTDGQRKEDVDVDSDPSWKKTTKENPERKSG